MCYFGIIVLRGGGGGGGGPGVSFVLSKIAILDRIKWNNNIIPHPP